MEFIHWIATKFGIFFGGVFLIYLFLIIHRLVMLYDTLREVPQASRALPERVGRIASLSFMEPLFERLVLASPGPCAESIGDAIWSELEGRLTVHFTAVNGYINTLILIGFAGTIFGSIGAFNEMFQGLARGGEAAHVFAGAWNHGLATALYTSLVAAVIGGGLITTICSRFLMARAKRLEVLVSLRICEILEGRVPSCSAEEENTASFLNAPRIRARTSPTPRSSRRLPTWRRQRSPSLASSTL